MNDMAEMSPNLTCGTPRELESPEATWEALHLGRRPRNLQLGDSVRRILFRCTLFRIGVLFLLDLQVPLKILVKLVRFKARVDGRSELRLDEAGCAAPGDMQGVVGVDSDSDEICFLKLEEEVRHQDRGDAVRWRL